jgi:hypothetical protein
MNIQLAKIALPLWKQTNVATILRKGVWLGIVTVSIIYSLVGSQDSLLSAQTELEKWIYVYLNFLSFVLGVLTAAIIFFRKPNSWMAFTTASMLVTFTATDNGIRFWYQLFTGVPFSIGVENGSVPYDVSLFLSVLYMALLTTSLTYVLLTFPEGKLSSRRVRWFFNLMIASQILLILFVGGVSLFDIFGKMGGSLSYRMYVFLDQAKAMLLLVLAAWPILRLRKITDPVQRQQIKWIAASLTGMTFFYAIYTLIPISTARLVLWIFLVVLIFTYGFIITLFIAILRYRLWDMNFIINKAIVYSAMTAVLGILGFAGANLLDFLAKRYMESDSSLVGAFILLPLAALFAPLRDGMQALVDRYLKPEEVDFSSAIVEFSPDAQLILSSQAMLGILVKQTVEQLDISSAAIYLKREDGQLLQSEPPALDAESPQLRLDDKARAQLEKGNVVIPLEASPFSLYIPLVINRASRPDFLGVLVLGPRNSGEGYPTHVLKSLKKLGCDAGKAIYIAQLRERLGQNILDRLAAIEKGLAVLHKSVNTG